MALVGGGGPPPSTSPSFSSPFFGSRTFLVADIPAGAGVGLATFIFIYKNEKSASFGERGQMP